MPGIARQASKADIILELAPLFGLALGSRVQSSHDALNAALKARAEASPLATMVLTASPRYCR